MDFSYAWSIREQILQDTLSTLYMTFWSGLLAGIIGLFFGIILVVTQPGNILENKWVYNTLEKIINVFRATPFIILLTVVAPFTVYVVGTRIGNKAAIVPLVISAAPYFAKQVEQALSGIDPGLIEAAEACGDSPIDIIFSVYLREGLPHLIRAASITLVSLLGLTTMAGAIGADGIGKLAINVGYSRYKDDVTIVSLLIILFLVFLIQEIANYFIKKTTH